MISFVIALLAMALSHGFATGPANGVYAGGSIRPGQRELMADGAVTPGAMLITSATDGKVAEAGDAAANVVGIAGENESYLNTSGSYLTDFGTGTPVPFYFTPGIMFYGIIKASSAALVFGDGLACAANGELRKAVEGEAIVATYQDPADFAPGGAATRKLCQFIGPGAAVTPGGA